MLSRKTLLTATLSVVCLAPICANAATDTGGAAQPAKLQWLRVPDALLSGQGINDAFDFRKQVEHVGDKSAAADSRKVVYAGQLRTSVIQGAADAIHLPSFPDDESFCIIVGGLTLTADETKADQVFYPGDCVFVPKGWAGIWRQHAGVYREWATVPASYSFSESIESNPPVKGAQAFVLEVPHEPGVHRLHAGSLIVEAETSARNTSRSVTADSDETIHILHGNLTLEAAGRSEIFKPGDVVIIPRGLNVEMRISPGYQAVIVRGK